MRCYLLLHRNACLSFLLGKPGSCICFGLGNLVSFLGFALNNLHQSGCALADAGHFTCVLTVQGPQAFADVFELSGKGLGELFQVVVMLLQQCLAGFFLEQDAQRFDDRALARVGLTEKR